MFNIITNKQNKAYAISVYEKYYSNVFIVNHGYMAVFSTMATRVAKTLVFS